MKHKGIFKTVWKVLEKIIMVAIIFISLVIVVQRASNNEKAFLGFRLFRVQTGSMIPKYNVGDVILVREKTLDKIKIGDDVTYNGTTGTMKGMVVTHQVIGIREEDGQKIFKTKGIANRLEDPEIYGGQIIGVVFCKSYVMGLITAFLNNKYTFYFLGIIPLTVFIFFSFAKSSFSKYEKLRKG